MSSTFACSTFTLPIFLLIHFVGSSYFNSTHLPFLPFRADFWIPATLQPRTSRPLQRLLYTASIQLNIANAYKIQVSIDFFISTYLGSLPYLVPLLRPRLPSGSIWTIGANRTFDKRISPKRASGSTCLKRSHCMIIRRARTRPELVGGELWLLPTLSLFTLLTGL